MNPSHEGATLRLEQREGHAVQRTDQAVETEIKLRLSPEARAALERHPAFNPPCASAPHTQQEVTTYFDTPDDALISKGVTLRIRRSGRVWKQTVKVARRGGQEPLQRSEWEWLTESDVPDLGHLAETPIAPLVRTIDADSLQPVFRTEIQRSSRLLRPDEYSTVEAAFDEGRIIAGSATAPVSEMELELKSGYAHSLYRLALDLLADVPLALETASKAERAFWLHTGKAPEASKAWHISIDSSASTAEAFKLVVSSTLGHLLANVGPADRANIEGVHQIRIAVRRLRAALALFKPHLPPCTLSGFNDELRRLGAIFGRARDWDVFVFETLPAAEKDISEAARLPPLRDAAEVERAAAHRAVSAELGAPSFARLVVGIAAWNVNGADAPLRRSDDALTAPVEDIAPDLLNRMWRKMAKRGRHMEQASREQQHALRKAVKKLRYSIEFLSTLYRRKEVEAYLGPCKDLQELLGTINDAAVTLALSEQLRDADEDLLHTIGAITEWATMRGEKACHHVSKPWHELRSADPFWH
jgi:triphosphatase